MSAEKVLHIDAVAIRKTGVAGWLPYKYVAAVGGTIITGGVPRIISKGKRKGKPNWDGCQSTTTVVTEAEISEQESSYSAETGNCARCYGEGKVFKSWHHIDGTEYRKCDACDGTGKVAA